MTETCPICQTPFPAGRLDGLCPACFLSSAFEFEEETQELVRGPEIARGGMGIVYEAYQAEPRRNVALKVLQPQWADNLPVRERFRREAQSMASLEHPAILPVYEVGETDGLPWFTMKLASGGSLADRLPQFVGHWQSSAKLMAKLARALGFAHERGILHRDVKPGNMLFDAEGLPYLADFGLAKDQLADAAELALTLEMGVFGTPNYLAPELASGTSQSATTASDIYSLGAVLYELLSGQPPHLDESLPALLRKVADQPPSGLSEFKPVPPRDLRSICEKAMSREPEHRYAAAREVAEDLERYLRGETVEASQPSMVESLWRWCRRHPAVAALLSLVIALLAAMAIGSTLAVVWISHAEREAIAARDHAEANARRSKLAEAEGLRRARQPRFRVHVLDRVVEAGAAGEDAEMHVDRRSEAIAALAFPLLHIHEQPPPDIGWKLVAVSSGMEFIAWHHEQGWRVARGRDDVIVSQSKSPGIPIILSRDGRRLATQLPKNQGWQLWDITQAEARLMSSHDGIPEDISDDGKLVAYYHHQPQNKTTAEICETDTNRVHFQISFPKVSLKMRFNPEASLCAIAPSFYLNDVTFPYSLRLHRCVDGSVAQELSSGMANCIWSMAWSRDGSYFAAGERGGATIIWNVKTGNPRHTLRGNGADMWLMSFSEDDQYLAAISNDRLLTVFDVVSGQPLVRGNAWRPRGVPAIAWSAAMPNIFGPVSVDNTNTLIRLEKGAFSNFTPPDANGSSQGIAISPKGRWLAVGDSRHARMWDQHQFSPPKPFASGLWNSFVFSQDGRWLYGAGEPGVVRWQMDEKGVMENSLHELLPAGRHNALALDASGSNLAAESGSSHAINYLTAPESATPACRDFKTTQDSWVSLTNDGKLLAAANQSGLEVWRTGDGGQVFLQKKPAHWVSFSPDGQWLVVGRSHYEVWRTRDWTLVTTLTSRAIEPEQARAAFTADGRYLATGHVFGKIALWSVPNWERFAILESPSSQPAGRLVFDQGGTRLFNASTGGVVEVWDLRLLNRELKKLGLGWSF